MDMKKIMKATERKAAALEKRLEGTGAEVYVYDSISCGDRMIPCPSIKVVVHGAYSGTEMMRIVYDTLKRSRKSDWRLMDDASDRVNDYYSLTIAMGAAVHMRKAAQEIISTVNSTCWTLMHEVMTRYYGRLDFAQTVVRTLYDSDDMSVIAAAYIARLEAAETVEDIATIKGAAIAQITGLKAAYDADVAEKAAAETVEAVEPAASTAAPAAVEPVAASSEAVELAETAKYTLDNGTEFMYRARARGVEVGSASVIVYDDGDAYVERIDVDDGYRNRGYGTAMLKQLAAMYGDVYVAPDNDDARRLYARLGDDVTGKGSWGYVDQGYGVYAIAA